MKQNKIIQGPFAFAGTIRRASSFLPRPSHPFFASNSFLPHPATFQNKPSAHLRVANQNTASTTRKRLRIRHFNVVGLRNCDILT